MENNFFIVVDVPQEWIAACQWAEIAGLLDSMVDSYVEGIDTFGTLASVTVKMVLCAHGKYWLIREGKEFIDNCDKFNAEQAPPELQTPNSGQAYESGSPMPGTCPLTEACFAAPRSPQSPESPSATRPSTPVVRVGELPAPRVKHIYIPAEWSGRYSAGLLSTFIGTLLPTYRDWLRLNVTLAGVRARLYKCPHGRFWFVPDQQSPERQYQVIVSDFEQDGTATNIAAESGDVQPSNASVSSPPPPPSQNPVVELAGEQDGDEFNITFQVVDNME